MKKQEILDAMRKSIIEMYHHNDGHQDIIRGSDDRRRISGAIMAMAFLASELFGYESDEYKEFKEYMKKSFDDLPEKPALSE